jgi:hypothetical protein
MVKKHDTLTCPECRLGLFVEGESPLPRYVETWKQNAENVFVLLRPDMYQADLANAKLFFLYEDCYHTLLIGRYGASIVLMGVLIEAIMKERIRLKLGINFRGAYGACLKKIQDEKLMDPEDITFLRKFKNNVRNPYQHVDDQAILKDVFLRGWPLQFEGSLTPEKVSKALDETRRGAMKPVLLPAANNPAIGAIARQSLDRQRSIQLFNQVYDFLLKSKIKYFKQADYDEHHKKFGTGLENIEHYRI